MKAMFVVFLEGSAGEPARPPHGDQRLVMGPLLGPLLFTGLTSVMIQRELDKGEKPLEVPLIGSENAPNLVEFLKQHGVRPQPPIEAPEEKIRRQDAELALRIPAGYGGPGAAANRPRWNCCSTPRSARAGLRWSACAVCWKATAARRARCACWRAACRQRGHAPGGGRPRPVHGAEPLGPALRHAALLPHPVELHGRHVPRHRHHRGRARAAIAGTAVRHAGGAHAHPERQARRHLRLRHDQSRAVAGGGLRLRRAEVHPHREARHACSTSARASPSSRCW